MEVLHKHTRARAHMHAHTDAHTHVHTHTHLSAYNWFGCSGYNTGKLHKEFSTGYVLFQ